MWQRRRRNRALIVAGVALAGLAATASISISDFGDTAEGDASRPTRPPVSQLPTMATSVASAASPQSSPQELQSTSTSLGAPTSTTPRSVASPPAQQPGGRKKGVSLWSSFGGARQAVADVGASWFYDWSVDGAASVAPAGVEYVPMIWGGGSVNPMALEGARTHGRVLLGFNEPDLGSQSNMTVEQALDLWPPLIATGMRLGSPAPAYGADRPGGWLDRFMSGAKTRGYRVDFIALHWYGADFSSAATDQLGRYLQATYDRYHLPIWLTEYALINFSGSPEFPTPEQQARFVQSSTAMMEHLSYVERYAWFALPSSHVGDTGLYVDGNTPTEVGVAYRSVGAHS